MSTWSDSMFPSDQTHVAHYPLVPSGDAVLLEPSGGPGGRLCGRPCGSCANPEVLLDLAALSEGNLSAAGRRRLFTHLARCRICRLVMASLDGVAARPPHRDDPDPPAFHDGRGPQLVAHSQ